MFTFHEQLNLLSHIQKPVQSDNSTEPTYSREIHNIRIITVQVFLKCFELPIIQSSCSDVIHTLSNISNIFRKCQNVSTRVLLVNNVVTYNYILCSNGTNVHKCLVNPFVPPVMEGAPCVVRPHNLAGFSSNVSTNLITCLQISGPAVVKERLTMSTNSSTTLKPTVTAATGMCHLCLCFHPKPD